MTARKMEATKSPFQRSVARLGVVSRSNTRDCGFAGYFDANPNEPIRYIYVVIQSNRGVTIAAMGRGGEAKGANALPT